MLVRNVDAQGNFKQIQADLRIHAKGLHSPEDHAILEAEYAKNSKPDKAARMNIVSRIALGEKEVQVSSAFGRGKSMNLANV